MATPSSRTIWHLLSNRWNSAITEYAISSARSLQERGWATFFSPLSNSPAEKRLLSYGIETRSFSSFGIPEILKFRRIFKEIKPDVIIAYGGPETTLLRFVKKNGGAKRFRFRGQDKENDRAFPGISYKIKHSHLDGLITPSAWLSDFFKSLSGIPVGSVILGCDTEKYRRISVPHMNNPETMEMIILGRFDPIKGHERFFTIYKMLKDNWPEEKPGPLLHIIGEPGNISYTALTAMGKNAGLVEDVDFKLTVGHVDNIAELMSQATLGVIPSLGSEIICRVGEEFLLCGTPIIVSGVGSLEEVLFDGAGASFKGLSDEGTVALIKDLLTSSSEEGGEMKEVRAAKAKAMFSLDTMGEKLEKIILRK